jgi:hypothetical protein
MNELLEFCTEKAKELASLRRNFDPSNGLVVVCTEWELNASDNRTLDFYAVENTDREEGCISARPFENFGKNGWTRRSGEPIDFWVWDVDPELRIYKVSYFHPQTAMTQMLDTPNNAFAFNCPPAIELATRYNKKQREKNLFSKNRTEGHK